MIDKINLGGQYDDPREWNGKNPQCKLCEKEIEKDDEYCEDHQRCYYCAEREGCKCKDCKCGKRLDTEHPDDKAMTEIDKTIEAIEDEEEIEYSCCGDDITYYDIKICPTCKEHQ